jgi:tetratricopeptide (TPR) repeat protein
MKSRFLDCIEKSISAGGDELTVDCLLAEKAAYLARLGNFDEARGILATLHDKNGRAPKVELSVWLNFTEGICSFYSDMGSNALDRLLRARALSEAAGLVKLKAEVSAWLAHLAFSRHDFATMAREIAVALSLATRTSHSCLSRASLVVGQAVHLAGRYDLAAPWYARARNHAQSVGDETTISAIIHNMTAIRLANSRQQVLLRGYSDESISVAISGADSTKNFDQLVGVVSLDSLTPILRAQALSLAQCYEEAIALYSNHLSPALLQGMARVKCWLLADKAWCNACLGMTRAASDDATEAILSISPSIQIDDMAATHSRLAQVFRVLGDDARASYHGDMSETLWAEYGKLQANVLRHLGDVEQQYALLS